MVSGVAIQRSANVCFVPIADIWGKPWLKHRPRLTMLVVVHGRTNSGILSVDGAFDPNMREALALSVTACRSVCRVPPSKAIK
jgi:hypothetical protein